MKVLIYGAGVQGSLLAHVLVRGGHETTVLARGARLQQLTEYGMVIRHYLQRKTTVDQVRLISELSAADQYDVIFVMMKYCDFPSVLPILAENCSENMVLVGNNATAAEMESFLRTNSRTSKQIAFGFQMSGGRREAERIIALRFNAGEMVIGSLDREIRFKSTLDQLFLSTKYKLAYTQTIDAWLKSHMISILPMTMALHLKNYELKAVAKDHALLKQIVAAMEEGYDVLTDLGYDIVPAKQAELVKKHKKLLFWFYKLYHYLPIARQVDGSYAEIKQLYDALHALQQHSRVSMPNMDAMVMER